MNTLRVVPVPPEKSIEPECTETVDRCRHLTLKRLPPHLAIGNNLQPGIFLQGNRLVDGVILTENAAILQYVAERFPDANISAKPGMERTRLQQWLCFIGTELHKGLFVSLLDPPESLREAASACRNEGTWPVLVGEEGEKDAMLSSPIILYD